MLLCVLSQSPEARAHGRACERGEPYFMHLEARAHKLGANGASGGVCDGDALAGAKNSAHVRVRCLANTELMTEDRLHWAS